MEPWLFTDELWEDLLMIQAIKLGSLPKQMLNWHMSKFVDRPYQVIDYKVRRLLGEVEPI